MRTVVRHLHPRSVPSLYDPARRQELVARLARLRPDAAARWGRFTAPKMLTHLIEAMRMASGELTVPPRHLPLLPILRPLVIHVFPFPKGAPTAREMLSRPPATWEEDVATLRARIEAVREPAPGARLPDHPAFGPMSARDWGVLMYKHADHHFRQFGI